MSSEGGSGAWFRRGSLISWMLAAWPAHMTPS